MDAREVLNAVRSPEGGRYPKSWVDNAIKALTEAGLLQQWQPIETAPRDGTPVQVARRTDMFGGMWVRGWARWESVMFNNRDIGGWIAEGYSDPPGNLGLGNPSHWMPLPSPPQSEAQAGGGG